MFRNVICMTPFIKIAGTLDYPGDKFMMEMKRKVVNNSIKLLLVTCQYIPL